MKKRRFSGIPIRNNKIKGKKKRYLIFKPLDPEVDIINGKLIETK